MAPMFKLDLAVVFVVGMTVLFGLAAGHLFQ
jgi:hypothetical protein